MIRTEVGPGTIFYRAFTPRWAHEPESGAGAAIEGGRFNRPGLEARYLALEAETALGEYQAESPLLPPATLVAFKVTAAPVVDLTAGYRPDTWSSIWANAGCNWKKLAMLEDIEPPSWVIGDLVRNAGFAGILYRSFRLATGTCLVLFPEMQQSTGFSATAFDPDGLLPRNAASWQTDND